MSRKKFVEFRLGSGDLHRNKVKACFFVRSFRGSFSPACAGSSFVRAISTSRSAAELSDHEVAESC